MGEFLIKIFELLLGENKEKRQYRLFHLKSVTFLWLILILFTSRVWNVQKCIKGLISEKIQSIILDIARIGAHLFTSLVIIAFVIFVIAAIIYEIMYKVSNNNERIDYFHRLRIGASFRFSSSLENVLIFLMMGYVFDNNFVNEYTAIYSQYLWICIFIACGGEFVFSSSIGVLNRFFVFWSPLDKKDKD